MTPNPEDIALAFSGHCFADTFDHLAADVRWVSVGGDTLEGRDAVVAACQESADALSGTTTHFHSVRTVVGSDAVVVDSVAEYVDDEGTSVVASCDLYDFADGQVSMITSYNVELSAPAQ